MKGGELVRVGGVGEREVAECAPRTLRSLADTDSYTQHGQKMRFLRTHLKKVPVSGASPRLVRLLLKAQFLAVLSIL